MRLGRADAGRTDDRGHPGKAAASVARLRLIGIGHRREFGDRSRRNPAHRDRDRGLRTHKALDPPQPDEGRDRERRGDPHHRTTERFEQQAEDFIQVAQDSRVITEVTVNSVAVESMTDDKAVVLVAASSRVTNSEGANQEPRTWRLSVDLERVDGQIKMSKVEFVP